MRVQGGKILATDGPFVETKEALGGYLLFEADDLDAAIELAARIPAARMGGAIGSEVAKNFAREGARVFLTGRTVEKLNEVAEEITAAGGVAEVAVVDARDEGSVDEHARVVAEAGGIDVSLNLVSRGDVQGIPLAEMTTADFVGAITTGITANFNTARAAARQMIEQGSGVILALNSGSAHGSPMMGNTGPADAAIDTFVRNLAAEIGPQGVRVLGLWVAGIPDTMTPERLAAVDSNMQLDDEAFQGLLDQLDGMRMLRRSPRLAEVVDMATFLVSDRCAMTGTFNLHQPHRNVPELASAGSARHTGARLRQTEPHG